MHLSRKSRHLKRAKLHEAQFGLVLNWAFVAQGGSRAQVVVDPEKSFDNGYAKQYTVTASALNMRRGASTNKGVLKVLKKGEKVTCYGYYTRLSGTTWLYVKAEDGTVGYCSKQYLK